MASDDRGKDRRSGRFAVRWIAMWGSTPQAPPIC
nr:MAG TPA: hypothetical protein [Caudoviricetes sp.]